MKTDCVNRISRINNKIGVVGWSVLSELAIRCGQVGDPKGPGTRRAQAKADDGRVSGDCGWRKSVSTRKSHASTLATGTDVGRALL